MSSLSLSAFALSTPLAESSVTWFEMCQRAGASAPEMGQYFYLEEAVLDVHVADRLSTDCTKSFEHLEASEHRGVPQVGDGTPESDGTNVGNEHRSF